MELRYYLRMVQRGWWIIALTTVAAVSLALLSSSLATPRYRTTARVIISPSPSLPTKSDILYGFDTLDRPAMMATFTAILNSARVYEAAGAALGLDRETLGAYKAAAVAIPDSNVIELSVVGSDPALAMKLADTIGQQMIAYAQPLYLDTYQLNVLDTASSPKAPISPLPLRDASLALMLGALVGTGLAIARGYLQQGIQSPQPRAELDATSSAYSRRFFERALAEAIRKGPEPALTVGLLHLGGLQELVEAQPRPVARQVLGAVTGAIRAELRGKDIVGRWDAGSFALLLPSVAAPEATRILEGIRQSLARPLALEGSGDAVTLTPYISAAACTGGEAPDAVMRQVSAALDRAKAGGSGVVQVDPEIPEPFTIQQRGKR